MSKKLLSVGIATIFAVGAVALGAGTAMSAADEDREVNLSISLKAKGSDAPIKNATVYVKFKEKRRFRRDNRREWSLKTNPEGEVTFPRLPEGEALIQIVAEGWRSYGKFHKLEGEEMKLEIELERPPKWF